MSRFRRNLASNFVGSGWAAIAQFACVPVYIRLLGIESYGLIGFYITLQAMLQVLDLGLSPTMNRQMAKYSVREGDAGEMRDFARTLEIGYWAMGVLLGGVLLVSARAISANWINVDSFSVSRAEDIVQMMGFLVAMQWPLSFYQGGMMGLQQQVSLNAVRITAVTVGSGGAIVVLVAYSPTIEAFFAWQIAVSALHVALLTALFWKSLPPSGRAAKIEYRLVASALEFAGGMTGIAFFGMILVQMDKVVVSRAVSLQAFGYYALAGTLASSLLLFINPIFSALFPRMSSLVACGDVKAVHRIYHVGMQLMAVLIVPAALMLVLFAEEIILAWTGSHVVAYNSAPSMRLLAIGTALNGLMYLPYTLQLAYGWTSIGFKITVAGVIVFLPLLLMSVSRYGAQGAAASWAALNVAYVLVAIPLTHRRLLSGDMPNWIIRDIGIPAAVAALVVIGGKLLWRQSIDMGPIAAIFVLAAIALLSCLAAASVAPLVREELVRIGRGLLGRRVTQ